MEKTIHSDAYKELREWLVQLRNNKNLSQRQLASLLDVPYSWVGKVEQGERRLDLIEYIRVCRVLDADPNDGLQIVLANIDK
jgi:transcriptional regulator with XRE-family HTH domain